MIKTIYNDISFATGLTTDELLRIVQICVLSDKDTAIGKSLRRLYTECQNDDCEYNKEQMINYILAYLLSSERRGL